MLVAITHSQSPLGVKGFLFRLLVSPDTLPLYRSTCLSCTLQMPSLPLQAATAVRFPPRINSTAATSVSPSMVRGALESWAQVLHESYPHVCLHFPTLRRMATPNQTTADRQLSAAHAGAREKPRDVSRVGVGSESQVQISPGW